MTRGGDAPVCPLCGERMREERGMEREWYGCVERMWMCPGCLHRMTTEDVSPVGDAGREGGGRDCTSM